MASIKKDDKTGTYYFVLDLPRDPVTGKRKQARRRGYKNKKEAQAAANELYHELTKGTFIEDNDISFGDFTESWMNYYSNLGTVKISTIKHRKYEITVWLRFFKAIPIRKITKQMYQDALFRMKNELNLGDGTIVGIHGCARLIFKYAREIDVISADPSEFAKLPKTRKTVEDIKNRVEIPKYLEKDELSYFLKVAKLHGLDGDYETFLTLAYSGLQIGEFTVLQESDIDFKDNMIDVNKTYFNEHNKSKEYVLLTPKSEKSIRTVEVDPIVTNAIRAYINSNKSYKMLHRSHYYDKGYIMPNKDKYPGYPKTLRLHEYRMKRILRIARLNTTLTPHSLRHTHTSLLAEAGVPLHEIMDRLGHKDDETTKLIYLHVTKARKKEATKKFGELMNSVINFAGM